MAEQNFTTNLEDFGGIYVLKCPDTQKIRYIGQTINFKTRKKQHFHKQTTSQTLKKWFLHFELQGKKPIFEIIFICDDEKIKDKVEVCLIKKFSNDIFNVMVGGKSGHTHLPKYKAFFNKTVQKSNTKNIFLQR